MASADLASSRALRIPEIVRLICEQVDGIPRGYGATKKPYPFPWLARTSKIFLEPALDIIWGRLGYLHPLVKCMPETLWEERHQGETGQKVIRLRRPILCEDLDRLLFYSVRVKDLYIPHEAVKRVELVHREVMQALTMALGSSQAFMPILSRLTWNPVRDVPFMHRLLGPNIQNLFIELDQANTSLSLLPQLKASCPQVTSLTLGFSEPAVRQSTLIALSSAVCGLYHLTKLTIPNLNLPGFVHISQLPSLTHLVLSAAEQPGTLQLSQLPYPAFPAFEYLSLACESPTFCAELVKTVSSPHFDNVHIRCLKNWTTIEWKEVFTSLAGCRALDSIEVSQSCEHVRAEDAALYTLSGDTIRPLLALEAMASLGLQIYPGLVVKDEFLAEMAVAWPKLRSLELSTEILVTGQPRATLACLIPFARHCPRLHTLGIRMQSDEIPEFSQVPGERLEHSLDTLYVGTSPIWDLSEDVGKIAAFVSNLFPHIQGVHASDHTSTEELCRYSDSWSRVSELVPVIASVRSQEKEFWTQELGAEEEFEEESSTEDDAGT
ncbi:hypothetical protein FB45DRAFT_167924 [Roridomyces roridus]|uniref:Uncharacterized protein n=1 Tax=Roridomyces roridus TaxID=1738132 RepID=A0AAD7FE01_9AGAR|nr:hypothetical protein FB45DRAFT_167924 [Roridomyces roridus]